MAAYYNEHDPFAAAWLRDLIKEGLIADGEVDDRSVRSVQPADLRGFSQCHFFAGIGGWSVALRLAGWPDDRPVWTGSPPCQPFSVAGRRKGAADDRHLWPEMFRLIRESRPATVFGEQVAAAVGHGWWDAVANNLEGEGYAVGAGIISACAVGAPHRRDRLWFVADRPGERRDGGQDPARKERGPLAETSDCPVAGADEPVRRLGVEQCARQFSEQHEDRGIGPMGDAEGIGRREGRSQSIVRGGRSTAASSSVLGDAGGAGLPLPEQSGKRSPTAREQESLASTVEPGRSPWAGGVWIDCADGKARLVEPGILLLAHGVSGRLAISRAPKQAEPALQGQEDDVHWYSRVGALRGFGNAIVPQVAAEIIAAYMAVKDGRS